MSSVGFTGGRRVRAVVPAVARAVVRVVSSLSFGTVLVGALLVWMAATFLSANSANDDPVQASAHREDTAAVELAAYGGEDFGGTDDGSGIAPRPRWTPQLEGAKPDTVEQPATQGPVPRPRPRADAVQPTPTTTTFATGGGSTRGRAGELMGGVVDLVSGIVSTVAGKPAGEHARQGLTGIADQVATALQAGHRLDNNTGGGSPSTAAPPGARDRATQTDTGGGPALPAGHQTDQPDCSNDSGCAQTAHQALPDRHPATQPARGPPATPRDHDLTDKITKLTNSFVQDLLKLVGKTGGDKSGQPSQGSQRAGTGQAGGGSLGEQLTELTSNFVQDLLKHLGVTGPDRSARNHSSTRDQVQQDEPDQPALTKPRASNPSNGTGTNARGSENVDQLLGGVVDLVSGIVTTVAGKKAGAQARQSLTGLTDEISQAIATGNGLDSRGRGMGGTNTSVPAGAGHDGGSPATPPDEATAPITCQTTGACPTHTQPTQRHPGAPQARGPPAPENETAATPAKNTPLPKGITKAQAANAETIVKVGQKMGIPRQGQKIALAAAFQESGLRNLNHGDRDSLGLFQQRPSQGWGTKAQVTDPTYAATQFYNHLKKVPGWQDMSVTQAAQAVQRSAYPNAYAKWEGKASALLDHATAGKKQPAPKNDEHQVALAASHRPLPVDKPTDNTRSVDGSIAKNGHKILKVDPADGPAKTCTVGVDCQGAKHDSLAAGGLRIDYSNDRFNATVPVTPGSSKRDTIQGTKGLTSSRDAKGNGTYSVTGDGEVNDGASGSKITYRDSVPLPIPGSPDKGPARNNGHFASPSGSAFSTTCSRGCSGELRNPDIGKGRWRDQIDITGNTPGTLTGRDGEGHAATLDFHGKGKVTTAEKDVITAEGNGATTDGGSTTVKTRDAFGHPGTFTVTNDQTGSIELAEEGYRVVKDKRAGGVSGLLSPAGINATTTTAGKDGELGCDGGCALTRPQGMKQTPSCANCSLTEPVTRRGAPPSTSGGATNHTDGELRWTDPNGKSSECKGNGCQVGGQIDRLRFALDLPRSNENGEDDGGVHPRLPTDEKTLKGWLDEARAQHIDPKRYAAVLQQYWLVKAANTVGIDLNRWNPAAGVDGSPENIKKVYDYYAKLYLNDPNLQWAGLANMIGPTFAAGFQDLNGVKDFATKLADQLHSLPAPLRKLVPGNLTEIAEVGSRLTASEMGWFESKFLAMQKHIFMDMASQHAAYTDAKNPDERLQNLDEMRRAGIIDQPTMKAWRDIASGNPELVKKGNGDLASREQNQVIANQYEQMYRHHGPVGRVMTYVMTVVGAASIPGTKTPGEFRPLSFGGKLTLPGPVPFSVLQVEGRVKTPLPDFNIANRQDRWSYITGDSLPAFRRLLQNDPQRAREIIGSSVSDRMSAQRLSHRWPKLVHDLISNWEVDFHAKVVFKTPW